MRVYEVHRDPRLDLRALLQAAVRAYYGRHRRVPPEVVVHKTLTGEARQALDVLDLRSTKVRGLGGCSVGEVWLLRDFTAGGAG
ncbi:MAG: hypothetical protein H5T61_15810 [Thermoflexales bacterium]|nr:hypothetical protein [Thermoflexales bacterium]